MIPWTRLEGTKLWDKAKQEYGKDPRRTFHKFSHVLRLYHHAAHTYSLPYDPVLDKAILAHNVVYDAKPNKALRSADWLSLHDPRPSDDAWIHVMRTAIHTPGVDNRIVLLDLADLGDPDRIRSDRDLLCKEVCAITGCSETSFARSNMAFLTRLQHNISESDLWSHRPSIWEKNAFLKIQDGITTSLDLCKRDLKALDHV